MPQLSSTRPTRRAASRRQTTIDSDSESDVAQAQQSVEDDGYDEALRSPRRRAPRPKPAAVVRDSRSRQMTAFAEAEDRENAAPEPQATHGAHKKRPAQTSRKSVRASRRSILEDIPDLQHSFPTPKPTASPDLETSLEGEALSRVQPIHEDAEMKDVPAEEDVHTPSTPQSRTEPSSVFEDVTEKVNNAPPPVSTPTPATITAQPSLAIPERPMDIVIRARTKPQPLPHENAPLSRTVITYLTLTNFKSYAGCQQVGPFHSSFSSVVGPNGSGKSNVIDSLLFVFGFRASKMRQGKISSLIHNSAAYPDLDHCEVEVHFQEIKDLPAGDNEFLPGSDLVISRRAFRNNSSSYYINGKTSNFTAVTTLLRDRGIDLDHKRFLILQGEVESIAQMKPKAANEHDDGLLEYLEDIIGTSKYKTPIEEAVQETDVLNEVCVEKNARVQHVEKEKKSLEAGKNTAIAYIKDENDLAMKQSALCQIYVHECADNVQVTEEAVSQMQAQLDAELEKHRGGEEGIRGLERQLKMETKEFEKLEQSSQGILKQLAKIDKESVRFEEKRKHLNAKVKKLEKTASSSQSGISEASAYLQRLADDIARNASSISEIEQRLQDEEAKLEQVRQSLKGKTQVFSDNIVAKQKLLEPWLEQINQKRSSIAVADSELKILQERDEAGLQAVAEIQSKIERLQRERDDKLEGVTKCKTKRTHAEQETKTIQAAIEKLHEQEPQAKARLSTARQRADEARSSLAKAQTQGNVLSGLTRLRESGRISGFHGRLGNLGAIDQKYDVAVSTACPALDNMVVDSVEVGQKCIEYLRKNNLGRANFICLDKLGQRDLSLIETPEDAPRLFDLVTTKDERFRPAFYSVMQNTIVANTLEQANRVAYGAKRWRVVTLNGQLIDKSGTMSGGGTRITKGAMSSKIIRETTPEQVAIVEAEQEHEEQQMRDFHRQLEAQLAALRSSQDEIPSLDTQIQRLQLEVDSLNRNLTDCQRRQSELAADKQPDHSVKGRRAALEKTIANLDAEISRIQGNTTSIEDEINALQEQIMEVGGVQLRLQKAKVDGLKEETESLNEEMSTAETNEAKTQKQLGKHEKAKQAAESELSSIASEMGQVDEEATNQAGNASEVRRLAEEAQEAIGTKREELQELKAEVERKTSELNETRGVEIEMRNKLEDNQKTLIENHKRMKYWQEKLGKLAIQNISDLGGDEDGGADEANLVEYSRDELADLNKNILKGEIAILEEKTQNGNADLSVISEYRRRVEEHAARSGDLAEAVTQRDAAKRRCEELRRLRLEGFMEGFSTISLRLKEMYQMITMGGNAELELVDSLDPFSEGILFSVMPPKKSWKNISNLSGGEKTLSSLALVFALHHYKPTPLYVMDEIDAALDFRNVSCSILLLWPSKGS